MNYTIEEGKGEVKIAFTLTAEEWDASLNKAYIKNKSRFNIPGFRKGHATRKMIEKMYGEGVFFDDAFNDAFYEAYSKALGEHEEIFPVDDPKVDIDGVDENGVKFHAVVTVKPEVTLGDYKGIKVDKVEYNVTADDVNAEIERARKQASRKVEVEGKAVENGDIVNLDYSGSVDGIKFEGGTASNQELTIGSHSFIPGFEEQMVGMTVGETRDLNVPFPTDYHAKELAGKDSVFTVTVNKILKEEMPELNDEFAKDVSKFDTFAEYKADVEKRLQEGNDRRANAENENALIEAVTANSSVEIPQCMVESQIDYLVHDMEYRLMYMYQGMKLEDYLKYTGSNMAELRKSKTEEAKRDVKIRLVLEAIVKAENLDVTDAELDAELARIAESAGKSVEEYRKGVDERQLSYIKNDLLMKKLIEFLKANNTFEVKKAEKKTAAKKPATKKAENGEETVAAPKKTAAKKSTAKKTTEENK